jgi:hypothetical protein
MRAAIFIFVSIPWLVGLGAVNAAAHAQSRGASATRPSEDGKEQSIDGVAARIEDDIITDSEVQELSAFQLLVDGQAKSRGEVIRELADQWIVNGEADTAKYPRPSSADADHAYANLASQFGSVDEFKARCAGAGLSEAAVRRILAQQLYLSRFLDYRFRPAAQVDQKRIQVYYDDEFAPQLKKRGETVPPLDDVADTIREVLIQRDITDRATQWLNDTRDRLKIDIVSNGAQP